MTSKSVQGVVSFIAEKPAGRGKVYNIKVGEEWFGFGFTKPSFEKGDNVKFVVEQKGNFWNVLPDTVEVIAAAPAQDAPAHPAGKNDYWDERNAKDAERQKSISWQSCRNAAIDTIKFMYEQEALKLTGKVNERMDIILDQIYTITLRYYDDLANIPEAGDPATDVLQEEPLEE